MCALCMLTMLALQKKTVEFKIDGIKHKYPIAGAYPKAILRLGSPGGKKNYACKILQGICISMHVIFFF